MSIKILIITGANTAREENPFGKKPNIDNYKSLSPTGGKIFGGYLVNQDLFQKDKAEWEKAESSLKEYRITHVVKNGQGEDCYFRECTFDGMLWGYIKIEIGAKVECEVNDQDFTCVIL